MKLVVLKGYATKKALGSSRKQQVTEIFRLILDDNTHNAIEDIFPLRGEWYLKRKTIKIIFICLVLYNHLKLNMFLILISVWIQRLYYFHFKNEKSEA